jgi:hypothetical protein
MSATGTPTPNLGLRIPLGTDPAAVEDINYNAGVLDTKIGAIGNDTVKGLLDHAGDEINALGDGLAIIANGNTHAAIAAGEFVFVRNHGSLATGLYKATTAIAANGALSSSNLAADSKGGLNSLSDHLTNKIKRKTIIVSCIESTWQSIPLSTLSQYGISELKIINVIPTYGQGRWIDWRMNSGNIIFLRLNTNGADIYIDDTAGDFSLDIIYTDNIASSN